MAQIKLNATYGLTGTLPAVSAANLTALNGSQVTSGTLPMARLSGTLPALNGSALTSLTSGNLSGNLPAISGASLTGISSNPTVVGHWRVTSNFSGDAFPIASNWEESDRSYERVGSAMTQSSGVFSFPSTGKYLIMYQMSVNLSSSEGEPHTIIDISTNGGSSWAGLTRSSSGGTEDYGGCFVTGYVDVTNVSNIKVQFVQDFTAGASIVHGDTDITYTGVTFIRLGDT
jgi:hypothetical protein